MSSTTDTQSICDFDVFTAYSPIYKRPLAAPLDQLHATTAQSWYTRCKSRHRTSRLTDRNRNCSAATHTRDANRA